MSAPATLRRHLSLRDLVVYGLLFIGPLAPVGVFGVLDARTDGAVALVYVLATVAMGFTAWSYARMSRVVPRAGSVFAYASEGIGPRAGFIAGWLAMLDYLLIPSVAYLFCGIALHALVPTVPAWVFTVAAFAATTALNRAGVAVAARVGTVVVIAEIVVLVLFVGAALLVLARDGGARPLLSPLVGLGGFSLALVVGAVSIAVLSFLGFDAIASFAEESAGDVRHVGTAITICLGVAGLLFVVQTWLGAVLSAQSPTTLAADPASQGPAFYAVARLAIGPWMGTVLAVTKAIGPAFAAMTAQAAASRLLYGMAREGTLPTALARVDAHGVPSTALGAAALLTLVVSAWAARRDDGLDILVSIVDLGALAAFTLLHASVVGYFVRQKRGPSTAADLIVPALGALTTIWVIVESGTLAKIVAGTWLVLGLLVMSRSWSRGAGD
ncbi:MAG: APC family permease [Vicinamibacterales bacterium]